MAAKTGNEIELSKQLGHLLRSPDRVKALVLLLERAASPKEIGQELGLSLSMASHHVNQLRDMGLIELVAEEPRRGTVAHFYRAVMRPIWRDEEWGELSLEERQQYATWVVQLANCDVAESLAAGTFNARTDTHTSRSHLCLDEQGRRELHQIQDQALTASLEVEAASAERLAGSGDEGTHVASVVFCIDLPAPKPQRRR